MIGLLVLMFFFDWLVYKMLIWGIFFKVCLCFWKRFLVVWRVGVMFVLLVRNMIFLGFFVFLYFVWVMILKFWCGLCSLMVFFIFLWFS